MPSLVELQSQMAAAILARDPAGPDTIRGDGIAVADRLAIYRGNTVGNLTDTLADAFPIVCQLVGEAFFAVAAETYIEAAPPATTCLAEYGGDFPDFLADFPPARDLPYLADVARLDWAVHRAFHAPDAATLDPARLAAAPPDDAMRLVPHPACHLVLSRYPVERIWRAHHGDGDLADIDLNDDAPCRLLVDRSSDGIRLLAMGAGECALLAALLAGRPLADALADAVDAEPALDLPPLLARHLQRGTFSDLV